MALCHPFRYTCTQVVSAVLYLPFVAIEQTIVAYTVY